MAKRERRKGRTWEGRVWRTASSANYLGSPDREPFPAWINGTDKVGYTNIRITEIIPKSKKAAKRRAK